MKAQNVKVTTTAGFDNVEIDEYLEPITAHVVVGMNFFKDFLSGFSDFFGGKSKSYQNTLASINEEVINELRKKAHSIGGNCVLGLKIDNDEVSAQGKSMMMVTALGTAAKASFSEKKTVAAYETRVTSVSNELLQYYKQKKNYISQSGNNSLKITDELWEFIKVNKVVDLADYMLNKYLHKVDTYDEYQNDSLDKFSANMIEYLSQIEHENAISVLYGRLQGELSVKASKAIVEKIIELQLIDFTQVIKLVENSNFQLQKLGIQTLAGEKYSYEKSDIELADCLVNLITTTFTPKGEKSTKKKSLSSKEKEIWICECGKENDFDKVYCGSCKNDIFGFDETEIKPLEVAEKLIAELDILTKTIS